MFRLFCSLLKNKITESGAVVTGAASSSKCASMSLSATLAASKPRKSSGRQESAGKTSTKVKSPRAREKLKTKPNIPSSSSTSVRKHSSSNKGTTTSSRSAKSEETSKRKLKTVPEKEAGTHENEDKDMNSDDPPDSLRPSYMSEELEKKVLSMAERMQVRDLSGEVPVASFAYQILKTHPSVRSMGLRERMDFLCKRWEALSEKERLAYLNHPLKGLL